MRWPAWTATTSPASARAQRLLEAAERAVDLREHDDHVRDRALVADLRGDRRHLLVRSAGAREVVVPEAHDGDGEARLLHDRPVEAGRLQRQCELARLDRLGPSEGGLRERLRGEALRLECDRAAIASRMRGALRELDHLGEPLPEPEERVPHPLLGERLDEGAGLGVLECLPIELRRPTKVLVVRRDPREPDEDLRALASRGCARELGHEERPGAVGVTRLVMRGRRLQAPLPLDGLVPRRQGRRTLEQQRSCAGGAAGERPRGRILEGIGDVVVRLEDRGGEMPGASLRILHELGESAVELRAAARVDRLVHARREQRMREPDAVVLELDDVGGDRRRQAAFGWDSRRLLDQADRGLGQRRCGAQELARLGRELQEPPVHELAQRIRDRQPGSCLDPRTRAPEAADDLQRVERVAAGCFVHLGEQRAGDRDLEVLLDDAVQRVEIERPDLDVVKGAAEAIGADP